MKPEISPFEEAARIVEAFVGVGDDQAGEILADAAKAIREKAVDD